MNYSSISPASTGGGRGNKLHQAENQGKVVLPLATRGAVLSETARLPQAATVMSPATTSTPAVMTSLQLAATVRAHLLYDSVGSFQVALSCLKLHCRSVNLWTRAFSLYSGGSCTFSLYSGGSCTRCSCYLSLSLSHSTTASRALLQSVNARNKLHLSDCLWNPLHITFL